MSVQRALVTERAPLAELNHDCLLALRSLASESAPRAGQQALLVGLRAEWLALDAAALERLAAAPFTWLDGGLRTAPAWLLAAPLGVRDATALAEMSCFPPQVGRVLMRRLLAYGWHIARAQPRLARLMLGCDGAAIAVLAECSLARLDAMADARGQELTVRWLGHTEYWRRLLTAAASGSEQQLNDRIQNAVRRVAADALRPPSSAR
jgi:hypothetical protein